jgi:predicted nucleic acid-binding Zn ribbon protein
MMDRPFPFRHFRPTQSPRTARQVVLSQWRGWDWSAEEETARRSAKSTAELMPKLLTDLRIDRRQSETEILRVWNNQLDPNIAAHAQPTGIRKGTLFVTVDSSVWLDEIVRYRRREILERLQNSFGRDLITRISFRVG